MSKRDSRNGFRNQLIEMLEQRRLLGAAVQAVPTTGSIVGHVLNDNNHNASTDGFRDDPEMAGVTVFIDANGNGRLDGATGSQPAERHVLSDSLGKFVFNDLPPGTYGVREITPKRFCLIPPALVNAVVTAGNETNAGTFLNTNYAVIQGTKHADQIRIAKDPNGLRVTINGRAPQILKKNMAGLLIQSGAGDDKVTIDGRLVLPARIDGAGGNDTLSGGAGKNWIIGGRGDDVINGGAAEDSIYGAEGNDVLTGGDGNDSIFVDDGINDFGDGGGNNWGNDSISGGDGNDHIDTFAGGMDVINGGAGNDTFSSLNGSVILLDGGAGSDFAHYFVEFPLKIRNIEHSDITSGGGAG